VRALAQVPHIYVHCHACSIFGGGSVCQRSLHASLQVLKQSLHNVHWLLYPESTLLVATARALALLSCIIKSMAMSAPANNTSAVLELLVAASSAAWAAPTQRAPWPSTIHL